MCGSNVRGPIITGERQAQAPITSPSNPVASSALYPPSYLTPNTGRHSHPKTIASVVFALLEVDRSPTGGPNERGAGEGSHTVAPPWTKYPVALGSESLGDSSRATEKRETPGGQNKSEIQEKENKQRIERGRAPCVCEVGRSD